MCDWELLAKNHICGRDWTTIRKRWILASTGFELDDVLDVSEALEPIVGPGFETRDKVTVIEFPGRHLAAFGDGVTALLKCAYVLRTVCNCLLSGQPTWASVDAYHFSFIAARALLAFLGIHFVQVTDTYCILDVFPEGLSDQETLKFRRGNPSAREPARLIFRSRSSIIEQRAIWTILVRTLRVAKLSEIVKRDIEKICKLGEGFGRIRNELLYRNAAWLYDEDFQQPSRDVVINDDIHSYDDLVNFFAEQRDANFAFAAIFARVLIALVEDIRADSESEFLKSSYVPCLTRFSGFGVSALDSLFETMYRKDSYGISI